MSYFTPVYNKPFTKVIGINDLLEKIHKGGRTAGRTYLENEISKSGSNGLSPSEIEQLKMLQDVILSVPAQSSYDNQWKETTYVFRDLDAKGLLAPGAYFKSKTTTSTTSANIPNAPNNSANIIPIQPSAGINKWVYIGIGSALLISAGLFVYFKFIKK